MESYQGLVALAQVLKDQTVLSVYVNGEVTDPARRRQWRIELRHALDDVARWLEGSSHQEREDFARRRRMVEERMERFGASVRAPGWVGFFTSEGEFDASTLPVPVPTMAVWSTGACLAPYIRALKEARPVVVAIVDHRQAQVYRYAGLEATPVETIRARVRRDDLPHMTKPPSRGFHHGTRGPTAADAAQRDLNAGTERMLSELVGRLVRYASPEGWLVVGGIPSMVSATLSRLPATVATRATGTALDVHATKAQVAEAARMAASQLRNADDTRRVEEALASVESDWRGAAGAVDTLRALNEGSVRELFITDTFLRDHAADAETAVRLALEHHAFIEHVSGDATEKLNHSGGVAARLRYAARTSTV
jgi:hypothetical protein